MYCKTCGEKSLTLGNYCLNDGTILSQERVTFKANGKRKFCQDCGKEGDNRQNYCLSCGSAMNLHAKKLGYKASEHSKAEQVRKVPKANSVTFPKFSVEHFKPALIPTLISLMILTLISLAILNVSQNVVTDLVLSEDSELSEFTSFLGMMATETDIETPDLSNIIGVTDVMMYSNLQNSSFDFKLTGSGEGETNSSTWTIDLLNGSFLYILVPFVSLFIGGIALGARNRENQSSLLGLNLSMAILYAGVLAVISIFAGFSYKAKFAVDAMNLTVNIANDYSFLPTLFLSFVFAFIFAGLGILFSRNYRKVTGQLSELMPFGEAVHQAFSTVLRGMGLLFIVFAIYFTSKLNEFKESFGLLLSDIPISSVIDRGWVFVLSLSAQLSNYVWNLLHLSPFTLTMKDDQEELSAVYSVFNGFTTNEVGRSELFYLQPMLEASDLPLYLKLALILPVLLFVWAGYRMAMKQENLITHVVIFSFSYALLMGAIASITDIGLAATVNETGYGSEEMFLSLGFSPFGVFLRSFLFAFLFSYAGTWVRKVRL